MERLQNTEPRHPMTVWGGIEYTVNRVGEAYFDQVVWSGHQNRLEDLDRFAELGIQAIRYPVVWERVAPAGLESADWRWTDERLSRLRDLGIRPIVGLLHHGSGPRDTSLIDPQFPQKLAAFARAVAERYPWVDAYTPVNEILTTARFSGLYGHWYPHGRSSETFIRALFNEVRGVQLAMQVIRVVNPQAQLIQTDDLGKVYSTPKVAYQAEHENERRWLSFDLLTGRVDPTHPLYGYLLWAGLSEAELALVRAEARAPDMLGINYYITSERLLDERLALYPPHLHGGNERDAYADVEAVRVCEDAPIGYAGLMQEAWDRYRLPLAATEVHLGAHREHQLRWLIEVWQEAQTLRERGVDLRAITVWSLLGAYNWHNLVTRDEGHYESGLYDVRSTPPRPTVLAKAVREMAQQRSFDHPVLDTPGWWRRPSRLIYPPLNCLTEYPGGPDHLKMPRTKTHPGPPRPVLITGARGTLGQAFQRICEMRGMAYVAVLRDDLDITRVGQIEAVMARHNPWAVINTAGYVRVDDAEREAAACLACNTDGASNLAAACGRQGVQFLSFSSDLVFDGGKETPYVETDRPAPLNLYGRSKAEAEAKILNQCAGAIVVRTSAFFGPWDAYNFPIQVLHSLSEGEPFYAANDVYISPTYVPDLVHACLDLLVDGETGIWHLANQGEVTWFDFARQAAEMSGLGNGGQVIGQPLERMGWLAARPRYSVLGSERAVLLPGLEQALERFFKEQAVLH